MKTIQFDRLPNALRKAFTSMSTNNLLEIDKDLLWKERISKMLERETRPTNAPLVCNVMGHDGQKRELV